MRSRSLTLFVALWWTLWVGVIVPGHTRGAIGLDGTLATTPTGKAVSFLFSNLPSCCQSRLPHDSKSPATSPDNCMICKLVGHTGLNPSLPTGLAVTLREQWLSPPQVSQVFSRKFTPTFHGRAPPASL